MAPKRFALLLTMFFACGGQLLAQEVMIDNLTAPSLYDNASSPGHYGQAFVSDGRSVVGFDFFQGVTSSAPNCISNGANLVLFEITSLGSPTVIGSKSFNGTALPCGDGTPASVDFDEPIPTQDGGQYVFIVFSSTNWDFGLTGSSSTYPDGGQAAFSGNLYGVQSINVVERDAAFKVRAIPAWAAVDQVAFAQIADVNADSVSDYAILSRLSAQLFLMTTDGRTGAAIKRVLIRSDLTGDESFQMHRVGLNLNILTSHPSKGAVIEVRNPSTLARKKRLPIVWTAP